MHADRRQHPVVDDDEHRREPYCARRRDLLAEHHEAAVAIDADHGLLRMDELRRDRRRHAIAHRARGRDDLRAIAAELVEAMHPAGIVAGAIDHDRVFRQDAAHMLHDLGKVDVARHLRRLDEVEIGGAAASRPIGPGARIDRLSAPRAPRQIPACRWRSPGRLRRRCRARPGSDGHGSAPAPASAP